MNPDAMVITLASDGTILDVNDTVGKMLGYSLEEMIGQDVASFWAIPDERARFVERLRADGEVVNHELRFRHKNGQHRDAVLAARYVTIGKEKCVLSITRDITDIRRMEEELHANRELLEAILSSAPIAINTKGPDLRFTFVNAYQAVALGYKPEEMIGLRATDFFEQASSQKTDELDRHVLETVETIPYADVEKTPTATANPRSGT